MNLDKIQEVLSSELPSLLKETKILQIIAQDEDAIPSIMAMLDNERTRKKELLLEMNMQLSRAHMALQAEALRKDGFIVNAISDFYNNQNQIGHCFQNYDQRNKKP